MTTKMIEIQGKPTSTVELKVERATGCFETVTFNKGVPVRVIVLVENDDAPDLLDALQFALDSEDVTLGDGGSILGDDIREYIKQAIAKAKGEK